MSHLSVALLEFSLGSFTFGGAILNKEHGFVIHT